MGCDDYGDTTVGTGAYFHDERAKNAPPLGVEGAVASEENVLLCDIPNCEASVSMVIGVPRSEHGWGRLTIYRGLGDSVDYDLCADHHTKILTVLAGN